MRHLLALREPLPRHVQLSSRFRHPVDSSRRVELTALYRARFADGVARDVEEAQQLAAHRFMLLGHAVDHGERIGWSVDPVSGHEWPRGFSADIPYRGSDRLGDIKLPWELNKHQYFFTLGKAAWVGDRDAWALDIVRQIEHWVEDNPCHRGIHWIGGLEAGARAVSWIMAYPFYADHGSSQFRERLAAVLAQHMLFVEQHLSVGPFANTHLVGEAAALVTGGLFLDCRHSARWLARGLEILDSEIERQVTADGVHAERSVAYHRFFLDQVLPGGRYARGEWSGAVPSHHGQTGADDRRSHAPALPGRPRAGVRRRR